VKYRVIIQRPAARDIDEAYQWIAKHAPGSAMKWFNGLEAAIQTLENLPQRCPLAEESRVFDAEIRQLIYGKRVGTYRVLFTVVQDAVHILHVRHGRRRRLRSRKSSR
jgi:plasmid stabilization system protein ParE